jgi:phosphohistidine phosphatase
MNLFILRHASAGLRRANPLLDIKRPLDKDGKAQCLQLAHVLNALKLSFDLVVSSPLKRSQQTAQLIATETGYEQKILISNALAPAAAFAQFQRLLRECSAYENVLIVGHNPNLTQFLGQLLGVGATDDPVAGVATPRIRLRKGSLARVSLQRGPAVLQSLIDPRVVRALYTTSIKSSRRKTSRK